MAARYAPHSETLVESSTRRYQFQSGYVSYIMALRAAATCAEDIQAQPVRDWASVSHWQLCCGSTGPPPQRILISFFILSLNWCDVQKRESIPGWPCRTPVTVLDAQPREAYDKGTDAVTELLHIMLRDLWWVELVRTIQLWAGM